VKLALIHKTLSFLIILSIFRTIIITLPLGQNSALDKLLKEGAIRFSEQFYLKRISKGNEWKEASWEDVKD
jgi:hypothetical protein